MPEISSKASLIKEAQKYLSKGQIDKAISIWEKLVKEQPDGNTYNALGDLYLKKGEKENAADSFHKAADFFMREGFSLKALGLYKKILNINPHDADALFALGVINEERGLKIDAIKYYLSAADSLSKEGRKERLLEIYDKIVAISPSNIPFRVKVADIYMKEGLSIEASKEYFNIAKLYEEKGETENSIEYYEKALTAQPSNKEVILAITYLFEKMGNLDRAIEQIKEATSLFPQDIDIYFRCAEIYSTAGRFDEAREYISKVTEAEPTNIKAAWLLGDIYIKEGYRDKAWTKYLPALDEMILDMNSDDAIKLLESFKDVDPIETGKRLVTLCRQNNENLKVAHELISLGNAYTATGMQKEALNCYKEALSITPDDKSLKTTITDLEQKAEAEQTPVKEEKTVDEALSEAEVFIKYGLFEDAINLLEEFTLKEPENIDLHLKLKSLYANTDKKDQVVKECLTLSELSEKAGDIEKSKQLLKEAYKISPEDPRLIGKVEAPPPEEEAPITSQEKSVMEDYSEEITEADFYIKQGLIDEAREILAKLHKLFPENEEIKQKLSSLETFEEAHEESIFAEGGTIESGAVHEPVLNGDVLSIFNEFKKGLEKELEDKDHETHYNLGLAYKELGFIDDAIKEFEISRNDPKTFVPSSSMLSICYKEKGLYPLAVEVLTDTLEKIENRDESYWALKYDLAEAYEKNSNLKEALDSYNEVLTWNSKFRDVSKKIRQIGAKITGKTEKEKPRDKKNRISYL
jgi:tetratricopeptide (TPR) repeat protein